MGPKELLAVIVFVTSLLLLLVGYLIGVRKQFNLIAGFDPAQIKDADGFAKWVGNGLLALGAVDLIISILTFVLTLQTRWFAILIAVVNVVAAGVLVSRLRRFLK